MLSQLITKRMNRVPDERIVLPAMASATPKCLAGEEGLCSSCDQIPQGICQVGLLAEALRSCLFNVLTELS